MKKVLKCVPSRFAKIINLGQKLGQSINFHSLYTKMRLRNMLKICLVFCKSEPQYAYKRYAYKKKHVYQNEETISFGWIPYTLYP